MFFFKKNADTLNFYIFLTENRNAENIFRGLPMSQEYLALQERKRKWIPLACIGKCSISQASKRIGITPNSVSVLKRRYRLYGDLIFINGHKGKSYQKKKYSDELRKKNYLALS